MTDTPEPDAIESLTAQLAAERARGEKLMDDARWAYSEMQWMLEQVNLNPAAHRAMIARLAIARQTLTEWEAGNGRADELEAKP